RPVERDWRVEHDALHHGLARAIRVVEVERADESVGSVNILPETGCVDEQSLAIRTPHDAVRAALTDILHVLMRGDLMQVRAVRVDDKDLVATISRGRARGDESDPGAVGRDDGARVGLEGRVIQPG